MGLFVLASKGSTRVFLHEIPKYLSHVYRIERSKTSLVGVEEESLEASTRYTVRGMLLVETRTCYLLFIPIFIKNIFIPFVPLELNSAMKNDIITLHRKLSLCN